MVVLGFKNNVNSSQRMINSTPIDVCVVNIVEMSLAHIQIQRITLRDSLIRRMLYNNRRHNTQQL